MFLKLKSVLFDYFKLVCKTIHLSSIGFGLTNIKQFLCLNMSICSRQKQYVTRVVCPNLQFSQNNR